MTLPLILLSAGFLAAVARMACGIALRLARWRSAAAVPVHWEGLFRIPQRYLRDVHDVVHRQPRTSSMHVMTAGGLVASLALAVALAVIPPAFKAWLAVALIAALVAVGGGLAIEMRRRHPRPAHLSGGSLQLLPFSLAGAAVALLWWALRHILAPIPAIDLIASVIGGYSCIAILGGLGAGAMKHALYGVLNLAFHPRQRRFADHRPDLALSPLNLSQPQLGVRRPNDFDWNRLLNFDACVECGRCETSCPAFAAGQPLNPKALVQSVARSYVGHAGDEIGYRGSPHPGLAFPTVVQPRDEPLVAAGGTIDPQTLWSCTTCSACVTECPMMVEHIDAIVELRRDQTLMQGAAPERVVTFLEDVRATGNTAGADPERRLDWASDLGLRRLSPGDEAEVILWTGDGAFVARNQVTLRATARLLQRAGVDIAVVGEDEVHCGDFARRLGDEALFQNLAQQTATLLQRYRFGTIVTTDPHVLHSIGSEYPLLGFHFDIEHHTTFLARLVAGGRLVLDQEPQKQRLTYHDPCYLGRYAGEYEAPRALLAAAGYEISEMERSGRTSRCCGAGGGAAIADVPGQRRIPDMRIDDAREVEADVVAVACPNCMIMLDGVVHPRPAVRDVAEILLERLAR